MEMGSAPESGAFLNRHAISKSEGDVMRTRSVLIHGVLPVFALIASGFAQNFRATLTGRVTDPSGGVIPGATVKAIRLDTNETREVITGDDGNYTIPYLNPGTYKVEAAAGGFQILKRENIVLRV